VPEIKGWSSPYLTDEYLESPAELLFTTREKILNTPGMLERIDSLLEEMVQGKSKIPSSLALIEPIHHRPTGQVRYAELRLWIRTDQLTTELYGEITFLSPEGEQAIAAIEL
jgi:hypothetical protein